VRAVDESHNDDVITIKPCIYSSLEQLYTVVHRIGVDHSPEEYQLKTSTEMSDNGLLVYIDTLLETLYYDEDPFDCIQFDIPSLPSILVKPHNLDLVKDRILTYLKMILSSAVSWPLNAHIPTTTTPVETPKKTKNHKKNKHHKKNKNSSDNEYENQRHRPDSTREHLFFDEDNTISSYYYDI
jgi:hypothetical protein